MFRFLLGHSLRTLLLSTAALAACAMPVAAQPAAAQAARLHVTALPAVPRTVLYIGSSFFYYNNGLNGLVSRMLKVAAPDQKLNATLVAISGSGFDWHDVESYFRPDAIGRYSFDDNNVVSFNPPADHPFDAAVMMDCSQCPIHPNLKGIFTDYAKRHADTVRRHGAQPVYFMSWAYADKPEMTAQLADAYTRAGNDNNALVIPAGLAFARVVRGHPEINLYADDKRHPSLAGSYLAAAVTYETLLGRSPAGNTFIAGLDPATARTLQDAAEITVREYLGR
jgi:hypothetical protein